MKFIKSKIILVPHSVKILHRNYRPKTTQCHHHGGQFLQFRPDVVDYSVRNNLLDNWTYIGYFIF